MKLHFPDIGLFLPPFLLSLLSLAVIASIAPAELSTQVVILVFSLALFFLLSQTDFEVIKTISVYIFGCMIMLLVGILLFGQEVRGSRRWLHLGSNQIQVSEFLKPTLILALAFIGERVSVKKITGFGIMVTAILVPFLLVFLQPDLGTALVILTVGSFSFLSLKPPVRYIIPICIAAALIMPLFWLKLEPYQKARVENFINPTNDPLGASYNQIQAVIAAGSGEVTGKGLGRGTQSHLLFLPEKHTDFFFASLAEELGFIGSVFVILMVFMLGSRLLYLGGQIHKRPNHLVFLGVFAFLFLQSFVHIGINLGLLPVTGITLPFMSVGGSSLLTAWIALGIASSAKEKDTNREIYILR